VGVAFGAALDGGQASRWDPLCEVPWYLHPAARATPTISGRRLDGPGVFRYDANVAIEASRVFATSTLDFSSLGCWEVTGRYRTSTLSFQIRVRPNLVTVWGVRTRPRPPPAVRHRRVLGRVASSSSAADPIRCTGLSTHSPSRGNGHCGVANLPVNSQVSSVIEFSHPIRSKRLAWEEPRRESALACPAR
jgi:hypothetical protein